MDVSSRRAALSRLNDCSALLPDDLGGLFPVGAFPVPTPGVFKPLRRLSILTNSTSEKETGVMCERAKPTERANVFIMSRTTTGKANSVSAGGCDIIR